MPGSEEFVQRMVHALEVGELSVWIKRSLVAIAIIALAVIYLYHVRGLATSQAMDQAQIGRAIAGGHGWRTQFIRPRAIGQLASRGKDVSQKIWRDTYNAPLPPLVDAIALFPLRGHLKMNVHSAVYAGDRAIAVLSMLIFIASIGALFLLARRLFDQRIALLVCGLMLLCDMMWQYALSGLPQMLLLLLFNLTLYAIVRATEEKFRDGPVVLWMAAIGAGFGLLALTHALTLWIFAAFFIFACFFFRPRRLMLPVLSAAFGILYLPWLIRTFLVCHNPAGVAIYSILDGIGQSEAGWMRHISVSFEGAGLGALRDKALTNVFVQFGHLFDYFGLNVVALMFFVSVLHRFRRDETAAVRWILLAMWFGAFAGMATYGIHEEQGVAANQLHLIFLPIMTCYGLAFLLVLWRRLGIELYLARIAFITALYLVSAAPLLYGILFAPAKPGVRWPPYLPPVISVLNDWMQPSEVTASDMPWAVAWYADRPSIWVPDTIKTMTDLGDYNVLGAPINGVYLTPICSTDNTYRDIVRGEYRDWAPVIQRTINTDNFPLKWATVELGLDNECVFFSDHDRSKPK
jgi:hypothetical protein